MQRVLNEAAAQQNIGRGGNSISALLVKPTLVAGDFARVNSVVAD